MKATFKTFITFVTSFLLIPLAVFAQGLERDARAFGDDRDPRTFADIVRLFLDLIMTTIPVLVTASMLVFLWGLTKFLMNADDPKKNTEGKNVMIWGLVGLFVLVSLWGILAFALGDTLGEPLGIPFLPEGEN